MDIEMGKEEFLTYILLYAASVDLVITPEEEEFIKEQVGEDNYDTVKELYDADTDAMRISRIHDFSHGEEFDKEYAMMVKNEIIDLFQIDGDYSHWEKSIGRALTRLMNS